MAKGASGNGFEDRANDNTQTRIRLHTAREEWGRDFSRKVLGIAAIFGLFSGLVAGGMYLAGRASAADLSSTINRTTRLEQIQADHAKEHSVLEHTVDERSTRTEKKIDYIDVKLDRLFEQSVSTAHRVGARELSPPPKHKETAP